MLNCNCGANCTCNKGISGLSNCQSPTSYLPAPLSGLGGLSIDFTGTLSGAAIGLALNHIFGWKNWQMSAAVGAITGGLLLPSMYN